MTLQSETATRGRPREFDRDQVLDSVIELFWEKGYEATAVSDIVEATGLNKSSLYNAFGSKDNLFDLALSRYVEDRTAMLGKLLHQGTRGLDDVESLLDAMWSEISIGGEHRGCLAVNTSTELGVRDDTVAAIGRNYRSSIRTALRTAFGRAADLGEIDHSNVDHYSNIMLGFVLGTAVIVRSGADNAEIREQLDAAKSVLRGWNAA